jgi:O-antigen ligase
LSQTASIALAGTRRSPVTPATLQNSAIAFAVFLGGFVIFEPAPYELFLSALLGLWLLWGLRIPANVMPLLVLLCLFNAGGIVSSFQIEKWDRGMIYVAVSFFLALSAVFFAIVVQRDMGRLRLIMRSYTLAAIITSVLGVIGYFGAVPGFEVFTRYSRAMGAFQDPNVFGPFLVAPALYLIYGIMNRSPSLALPRLAGLAIICLGLLLAFSRAAWGLFLLSGLLFYFLLVVNERSPNMRLKYVVFGVAGVAAGVVLIAVALHFDAVSQLFAERFQLVQSYDGGREGRFARHAAGYLLALEKPFGIGPLEFGYIFTEDTHNIFLKSLMDYGWLGFFSFMAMIGWTLIGGFRMLFRPRPWQPYFQIAYVVVLGHITIGNVIDIDHWRHFYLLIGICWGCMALELAWQREKAMRHSGRTTRPTG